MNADCGGMVEWAGLYKKDYDLCTPESFAHPAKASWDLAFKIIDHLQELGLLHESDTILDPMAGTARFLIAAGAKGFKALGVELEEKFCVLARDNVAYASKKLNRELGITILQGDARQLSGLLEEKGLVAISSPPYADSHQQNSTVGAGQSNIMDNWKTQAKGAYSDNPSNIGNLPDKPLKAIMSPPYANPRSEAGDLGQDDYDKETGHEQGKGAFRGRYGSTEGQIGSLPDRIVTVTSPPYADAINQARHGIDFGKRKPTSGNYSQHSQGGPDGATIYGQSEGQLGQLRGGDIKALTGMDIPIIIDGIDLSLEELCQTKSPLFVPIVVRPHGAAVVESVIWQTPIKLSILLNEIERYLKNSGAGQNLMLRAQTIITGKAEIADGGEMAGRLSILPLKNGIIGFVIHAEEQGPPKWLCIISFPGKLEALQLLKTSLLSANPATTKLIISDAEDISISAQFAGGNMKAALLKLEPVPRNAEQKLTQRNTTDGCESEDSKPNYLSEMKKVYEQIALVADVLCVVVKCPTRNGKLRRLDLDTIVLLEATGWEIKCHHHALLFEEQEQAHLFDGVQKKVKGRMSFFKRLSWQRGSPVAAWEDVIVAVRDGGGLKAVMSPPYESNTVGGDQVKPWRNEGHWRNDDRHRSYGDAPGQIGKLR